MALPFVDTDVIIRLLTGDDPTKQAQAAALFEQVEQGHLQLTAPDTVIADAVYVLSSPRLYHLPRAGVAALLTALVRFPRLFIRHPF
jgi:predicted nucleic acid-binding protein